MSTKTPPTQDCISLAGNILSKGQAEWPDEVNGRDLQAYALVLIEAGGGFYWDKNGNEASVQAGDVLILFPGLHHRYGRRAHDPLWSERYLVFNGPLFQQLELNGLINRDEAIWHSQSDPGFRQRFAELVVDFLAGRCQLDPHSSVARVHSLIAECHRLHRQTNNDFSQWRDQACARLTVHLDQDLILSQVAHEFHCSEQTFRKRFRQEVGISPQQFRLQRRLDHAQELLMDDSQTLEQIADACAFCDQYHFSRMFKRHRSMSPGQFRRQQGLSARARAH